MIQHRLAQLSPTARALANMAATLGRAFTFDLLAAASEKGEEVVVNGLDKLWRRRVIRERGANEYDFSHDRIREAAYAELSPMRRKLLHRRAAQALEVVYADDLDAVSGQMGLHCERAGQLEQAVDWYQRAGQVAWGLHAFHEATNFLRAAIGLLSKLPATHANMVLELMLQITFAEFVTVKTGLTHAERQNALLQAKELATILQDMDSLANILCNLGSVDICAKAAQSGPRVPFRDDANGAWG